jgi:putative tricarboxylic transport membrane protein
MGRSDRISGVFWLCFAILATIESRRLGMGTLHQPGPGFLFFWVNIALGIMALVVLIRAWAGKKIEGPRHAIFGGQNISKIIYVMLSLFIYILLMETVGFILVTLLLFIFLLGIIEKKRWYYTAIVSIAVTVAAYLIFETWLQSQLPKGLLGFLRL